MMKRLLSAAPILALALVLLALSSAGNAKADQPISLWLPWEGGTLWIYTQGPHSGQTGLDFQPPDAAGMPCDVFHSSFWVVAAAPGRAYVRPNGVEIDHGNGFSTGYLHLENKQVRTGDLVQAGDRLGAPACCPDGWGLEGCWATGPHVHFYTVNRGVKQNIVGLNLGGWHVSDDGCLRRNDQTSCPLEGRIVSNSPRQGQNAPSTPADLALIVDASHKDLPDKLETEEVGMALLQASRADDRISVIEFNGKAKIRTELRPAVADGALDQELAQAIDVPDKGGRTNLRLGLVTGCAELQSEKGAPAKAAILVSDGQHNVGAFEAAEECYQQAGIPVFSYAVGRANSYLLRRIAERTGGEFHRLSEIDNLYCEFYRIRTIMSGDPPGICTTFPIKPGEKLSLPFRIPPEQDQAVMQIRWRDRRTKDQVKVEGIPVRADILGPSGRALKAGANGIVREAEDGSIRYVVTYPETGEWRLVIAAGEKLPPEGLFITFSASTIPQALPYFGLDASPTATPLAGTSDGPCMAAPPQNETLSDTPTPSGGPEATRAPAETNAPEESAPAEETPPPATEAATPADDPSPVNSAGPTPVLPLCAQPSASSGTETPAPESVFRTPEPSPTDGPTPTEADTPTPVETPTETPPAETPPPDTPPADTPTPVPEPTPPAG